MELTNRVALVTGGAHGIGRALCRAFKLEGTRVAVADIDLECAEKVAAELDGLALKVDVSEEGQIVAAVEKTEEQLGPIDIFVSNAGVAFGDGPDGAASAPQEHWRACLDINLMAHVYAARAMLPRMTKRGGGSLVNVVSAAGLLCQIGEAAYTASKHAAVGFSESLAITHGDDGIHVCLVCPQAVATRMAGVDEDTETEDGSGGFGGNDVDGILSADYVADCIIAGIQDERFLVLPHPQVSTYFQRKANDPERWIRGMRPISSQDWRGTDMNTRDTRTTSTDPGRIDLSGKIALVNGASRGIGEAIARGLASCGAQVVLSSRRLESVQQVADSIIADGGQAVARACHAGRLNEIDEMFEVLKDQYGRCDILINNAATNPYFGPAAGLSPEAFDKTVEVNLKGPYFMISRALPLMMENGGGSIVNVASIAALLPAPGQAVYAMTKAGLVSLTRSFAKEYGRYGVRVNAILPGVVDTKFASAMTGDPSVQRWLSQLPVPRAGQTEDMVAGVLYLVSDNASYTTGTSLVMDGGATLG